MDKINLRKTIKSLLCENSAEFPLWSKKICDTIINSPEYKNARTILAFSPLPDEPDIFPVIQDAIKNNKSVYLPKINTQTLQMDFFPFQQNTQFEKGKYGILEPLTTLPPYTRSVPQIPDLVLVLVPGRAFTPDGRRLGRGKAYYDRYFATKNPCEKLAGVCFPIQLLNDIPTDSHDIKMNIIFS